LGLSKAGAFISNNSKNAGAIIKFWPGILIVFAHQSIQRRTIGIFKWSFFFAVSVMPAAQRLEIAPWGR
jgi:hypothetical protein